MNSLQSLDLNAISLSLTLLLTTYTTYLCSQPPNPTPYNSKYRDRLMGGVTPHAIFTRALINITLGLSHAFLSLTYPSPPQLLCPNTSNLSSDLFTWTSHTIFAIVIILLGSIVRLSAFSALGTNFTFRLDAPKKLITDGLYSYVQHPSYTGKLMIIVGNLALLQRPDGVLGCWLPGWIAGAVWFWRVLGAWFVLIIVMGSWKRVGDEEEMLKDTFGEEWEVWHASTKRFVPGLF